MTDPAAKFDAELAWDLQEWHNEFGNDLIRDEVKSLAAFLNERGYHKGAKGIRASVEYVEKVAKHLSDEFAPIYDILVKNQK